MTKTKTNKTRTPFDVVDMLLKQRNFDPLYPTDPGEPHSLKWEDMVWQANPHIMLLTSKMPE